MPWDLRYQWKSHKTTKAPLELTLEYGPQRINNREATLALGENGITWQNQAHVYYSTTFIPTGMERGTLHGQHDGCCAPKVLEYQCGTYAEKRRRYQPFIVLREKRLYSRAVPVLIISNTFGVCWPRVELKSDPCCHRHFPSTTAYFDIQRVASGDIPEDSNISVSQQAM